MADELENTTQTDDPPPLPAETVQQQPAVQPRQETRQPIQPTRPQFSTPEPLNRARSRAAALDEQFGANGQLKGLIDDISGVTESVMQENMGLREQVEMQGNNLTGIDYWQRHDMDPKNKDYPSSVARNDYLKDLAAARSNPIYAGSSPAMLDAMARAEAYGSLNARIDSRRNSVQTTTVNAPATSTVKPVGTTRPIPRGATQAPPAPEKKLTIQQQLEQGQIPGGFTEDQINAEFK